jgi:hypothetical protein
MSNKSCQTDFVKYTEATPLVTVTTIDEIDDDCEICECCYICFWYLMLGLVLGLLYYYTSV